MLEVVLLSCSGLCMVVLVANATIGQWLWNKKVDNMVERRTR